MKTRIFTLSILLLSALKINLVRFKGNLKSELLNKTIE